ncbi:hypothetical protein GHT06_017041 [Daphnia sinensis]|uniref:Uncharacterized protein n=1 Tax=Daphnia sinensis TaxID=1820382 RepID=A0AAD5PRK8_9CRUS|nr:hypothetical protein GHT06_017041 [Daphnia sinensis]
MKTIPTLSAARADAVCRRVRATTRLSKGEVFLDLVDAPREEIRKFILKKLGQTEGHQRPKAEFLDGIMNGRTLLHRSVEKEKLDVTDLLLYYGADPDIEEDGQTIAHIAGAENNKLLLRILRMHGCRFAKYNSLGETPLMVAIAYGHEDIAKYLCTVLHYAARYGNKEIAKSACQEKRIDINQRCTPGNYTALHMATIFRHTDIMSILIQHNAEMDERDIAGRTPQEYATDKNRREVFEYWDKNSNRKCKASDSEEY